MKKFLTFINEGRFDDLSIKSITKEFGLNPDIVEKLSAGYHGIAYKVGDKVIKITDDVAEYKNALKLKNKPVTKYLINYYDARRIDKYDYIFIILMDYVKPLWDDKKDDTEQIDAFIYEDVRELYDLVRYSGLRYSENRLPTQSELKQQLYKSEYRCEKYDLTKEEYFRRLMQVHEIHKEGKKLGITLVDMHIGNIGMKDDHYVYFDIGCDYTGGKPKHLKKFNFNTIKSQQFVFPDEPNMKMSESVSFTNSIKDELAQAAQKVYDGWEQNEEGYCDSFGHGGICGDIANVMTEILWKYDIECTTVSSNHEQHVYVVAKTDEGVFSVDIPWSHYETGGGFCWKKIPDVELTSWDIQIYHISSDPEEYNQYIED